jgi:metal-sulfur cluster biosynthetic enzyme
MKQRDGDAARARPSNADVAPAAAAAVVQRGGDVSYLWQALREVRDPELPVSLVDLGLIYDIRASDGRVDVDLTFTATACPCMAFIRTDIEERLMREPGVKGVSIHEVWDPPWTADRITPEGREALRRCGVAA